MMSVVEPLMTSAAYNVDAIRAQFPILSQTVNGQPLVYLDNAASVQKPASVIEAEADVYRMAYANIHRGVHTLSQTATTAFESVRGKVRDLIHARSDKEIVFTRGTTESINLVANSYARPRLRPGDEILVTGMEHHSNIVPWQLVCEATGAQLRVIPVSDSGEIRLEDVESALSDRTRLLGIVHVSNVLGTVNPVAEVCALARAHGVPVLVDAAQSIAHQPVDVQALGCDFLAFSGHKLYGPSGTGVLWGKAELLAGMPPWQGGGDMIRSVSFEGSSYADPPARFEAGTPNIAGVIGLGAAVDWYLACGPEAIARHEHALVQQAEGLLRQIPGLRIIGEPKERSGAISFVMEQAHPHDIGTILDGYGVAVRTGHHCAEPLMRRFAVPATARASFAAYNTAAEVEQLATALDKVRVLFA